MATAVTSGSGDAAAARDEMRAYAVELADALPPYASAGGARIRLGVNIAHHDDTAADLEGYARPLWGLAPLAAGGSDFAHWDLWVRGLAAGTDPGHPEYWGAPEDIDQRTVESAAFGFALALAPDKLWDPLSGAEKDRAGAWLARFLDARTPENNWNFFPIMVSLGLDRVGYAHDRDARHTRLDRLETYALADGWYSDGPTEQRDYYIPWAMHFYGLIYAALAGDEDPARTARFRQRAGEFALGFRHWFADDGSAVPYGRSLTYRFAQGSFWGALAYADVDALPAGEVKGLLMRHLRWWRDRSAATSPGGLLSIGYGYPQPAVAEQYNGPGSPYWAMKAFLPLALPADHRFWAAEEQPLDLPDTLVQQPAGAVLLRSGGDVTLLSGRQHNTWARGGPAKYAKFAYSTRFGFSLPAGELGLAQGAYDSMLAVSDDEGEPVHFRVREACEDPAAAGALSASDVIEDGGTVRSTWRPWADVEITTWLTAAAPWHLRTHRIRTGRALHTAEGGFAVDRDGGPPTREEAAGRAAAVTASGNLSGLLDLPLTPPLGSPPGPVQDLASGLASGSAPGLALGSAPARSPDPTPGLPPGSTSVLAPGSAPAPAPGSAPGLPPGSPPAPFPGLVPDSTPRLPPGLPPGPALGLAPGLPPGSTSALAPGSAPGLAAGSALASEVGSAPGSAPGYTRGDGGPAREGVVIDLLPGTNVLARRTVLPTLLAHLPPGEHWLRCAVLGAGPSATAAWRAAPPPPRY